MYPILGRLSDTFGRKPFLLLSFGCHVCPVVMILLYLSFGSSLLYVYPATVLAQGFTSTSIALSYSADLMSLGNRTNAFGAVMAMYGVALIVGPCVAVLICKEDVEEHRSRP